MDQIRSLRSTWWSIGIVLRVSIGLGILFSDLRGNDIVHNGGFVPNQTALTLRGFYPAQLAIGVLGVLFVTGQYSTGMIRATLSAVPRRVPAWAAKVAVFTAFVFIVTLIAAFIAFLGGQAALGTCHLHGTITSGPKGCAGFIPNPNAPAKAAITCLSDDIMSRHDPTDAMHRILQRFRLAICIGCR